MPPRTPKFDYQVSETYSLYEFSNWNYHRFITVSFKPGIYSRNDLCKNIDKYRKEIVIELIKNHPYISKVIGVIEYHKNKREHLHFVVCSDEDFPRTFNQDMYFWLTKTYGSSQCQTVADMEKCILYVEKDIDKNNKMWKENYPHDIQRKHYIVFDNETDLSKPIIKMPYYYEQEPFFMNENLRPEIMDNNFDGTEYKEI